MPIGDGLRGEGCWNHDEAGEETLNGQGAGSDLGDFMAHVQYKYKRRIWRRPGRRGLARVLCGVLTLPSVVLAHHRLLFLTHCYHFSLLSLAPNFKRNFKFTFMGRWSQYDEVRILSFVNPYKYDYQYLQDDYRLPEGFKRVGYDADSGKYIFRDNEGQLWEGQEGERLGEMTRGMPAP
jgi:hypothetical protein